MKSFIGKRVIIVFLFSGINGTLWSAEKPGHKRGLSLSLNNDDTNAPAQIARRLSQVRLDELAQQQQTDQHDMLGLNSSQVPSLAIAIGADPNPDNSSGGSSSGSEPEKLTRARWLYNVAARSQLSLYNSVRESYDWVKQNKKQVVITITATVILTYYATQLINGCGSVASGCQQLVDGATAACGKLEVGVSRIEESCGIMQDACHVVANSTVRLQDGLASCTASLSRCLDKLSAPTTAPVPTPGGGFPGGL